MPLTRLVYYSENQLDPAQGSVVAQLAKILSASNRNNKPKNITGALVFDDLWFLQVLEGDRQDVWHTFERIKDDERHSRVTLAEMCDVQERIFGNWWMGLATKSKSTEAAFAPFLMDGRVQPDKLSAQQILALTIEVSKLGLTRELKAASQAV